MNINNNLYLQRANNELKLIEIISEVSKNLRIQIETFKISAPETYYSAVISHAYYCIFYSAKAYLLFKGIKTDVPQEHQRTYLEFKKLAEEGIITLELLKIYDEILIKSEDLIGIFKLEKSKRGKFTYKQLPQANVEPAKESIDNAAIFFRTIYNLLTEMDKKTNKLKINLDLKVGKILEVNEHPNADKLFVFKVDLGESKERTIVAGLRGYYKKEELEGKKAIFISNLEPAKLRGIESNGMILAAVSDDRKEIAFLKCKTDVKEGTKLEFMES